MRKENFLLEHVIALTTGTDSEKSRAIVAFLHDEELPLSEARFHFLLHSAREYVFARYPDLPLAMPKSNESVWMKEQRAIHGNELELSPIHAVTEKIS